MERMALLHIQTNQILIYKDPPWTPREQVGSTVPTKYPTKLSKDTYERTGKGHTQSADTPSTGIALYREGNQAGHSPPLSSEASCLEQACLLSQLKPAILLESHSRHIPCLPPLLIIVEQFPPTGQVLCRPQLNPTEKSRSHFWGKGMEPISGVWHSSGS